MTALESSEAVDDALVAAGRRLVEIALSEDLGGPGDLTSAATIPPDARGEARLVVREPGVVAGLWLVAEVYHRVDPHIEVRLSASDGEHLDAGGLAAVVTGPLAGVLTGERTALNLVGHLSGVATATRAYVAAIDGTGCTVRDTRKTTPGMRLLEKAAVRAGGGRNHRIGLFDALLVKDNHVAVAGSVTAATRAALDAAAAAGGVGVQIEVDTLAQLDEALQAGACEILLDNFTPQQAADAVARVRSSDHGSTVVLEASGGIDLSTARAYAEAGVDHVSVGAITHSARQLDVALDVDEPTAAGGRGGGLH
jgi:nicotinate-nucleotide pyrophosphorylase (carboxylating)